MNEEPIDLESVKPFPEYYPALDHVVKIAEALPFIRDIAYFKIKTLQNADEIIDVQ